MSQLIGFQQDRRIDNSPDPKNFKVEKVIEGKDLHLVIAKYPNAINYEGVKVMVYKGKYSKLDTRDPHFYDSETSPIARFKPSAEGIGMAVSMVLGL